MSGFLFCVGGWPQGAGARSPSPPRLVSSVSSGILQIPELSGDRGSPSGGEGGGGAAASWGSPTLTRDSSEERPPGPPHQHVLPGPSLNPKGHPRPDLRDVPVCVLSVCSSCQPLEANLRDW